MMELLGVILVILLFLIVGIYFTVFPTVLNITLSLWLACLWARGKSFIFGILCFFSISLALTFGTRLPDFLYDALRKDNPVRFVVRPLDLNPGDTLNIAERYAPVKHRSAYFATSWYVKFSRTLRIGGPYFYTEDVMHTLKNSGLRLNYGEPEIGAPTLTINVDADRTHQTVTLALEQKGGVAARFEQTSRQHFLDELGAGTFRHHLLHSTKNSLWNWVPRILERRQTNPLTTFLKEALIVAKEPPSVPHFAVEAHSVEYPLRSFDQPAYWHRMFQPFDCTREDAPTVDVSGTSMRITGADYELVRDWRVSGIRVSKDSYTLRVACGRDGYLAWIDAGPEAQHFVLVDRNWRPVAAIDTSIPGMERREGRQYQVLNFYQHYRTLVLELLVRDRNDTPDGHRHSVITAQLEHPKLALDYGSQAARWANQNVLPTDATAP